MDWIHTESVYYAEVKPIFVVAKQLCKLCNFATLQSVKKNTRHKMGRVSFLYMTFLRCD